MKTYIFTVLALICLFSSQCHAQEHFFNTKDLIGKTWEFKGKSFYHEVYTDTKIVITINDKKGLEQPYYLVDKAEINAAFDHKKVGTSTTGKYIKTTTGTFEIMELTSKRLTIRNVKQDFNLPYILVE